MGSPTRPARWGEDEPRYEVKAYLPDTPTKYSERRRDAGIPLSKYSLHQQKCTVPICGIATDHPVILAMTSVKNNQRLSVTGSRFIISVLYSAVMPHGFSVCGIASPRNEA